MVKDPPATAGAAGGAGSVPEWRGSPGGGDGRPLPCSCLGIPMDGGAWRAIVRGVRKEWGMT